MKILTNKNKIMENTAVCLGKFDGIHLGHQKIIDITVDQAIKNDLKALMHTFFIHPENFMSSNKKKKLITDEEAKEIILTDLGMDYLYIDEFNEEFKCLSPEQFVKNIIVEKLRAKVVVVGFNYRFGHKRSGDTNILKTLLEKHGIRTIIVPKVKIGKDTVSSTLIRHLIEKGEVKKTAKYLNRNHFVIGKVISGKKIGSTLGFPTANIKKKDELVYPKQGVYITYSIISGKKYNSITNIGINPTVGGKEISIETHIISMNENLYNNKIRIEFLKKIRKEMKFSDIEELKEQIKEDIKYAENYFRRQI